MRNPLALTFFLGAVVLACTSAPVLAKTGDMFADEGYTVLNRPPVESDKDYPYTQSGDLFPQSTQYVRADKDVFDSVRIAANPGVEERFSAHLNQAPPVSRLYNWPADSAPQ
jgi:hypothetical protein